MFSLLLLHPRRNDNAVVVWLKVVFLFKLQMYLLVDVRTFLTSHSTN